MSTGGHSSRPEVSSVEGLSAVHSLTSTAKACRLAGCAWIHARRLQLLHQLLLVRGQGPRCSTKTGNGSGRQFSKA